MPLTSSDAPRSISCGDRRTHAWHAHGPGGGACAGAIIGHYPIAWPTAARRALAGRILKVEMVDEIRSHPAVKTVAYYSILKFFQVDITGVARMTSYARSFMRLPVLHKNLHLPDIMPP